MSEKICPLPQPTNNTENIIIDAVGRFLNRQKINNDINGEVQCSGLNDRLSVQPGQFVDAIKNRNRKVGELLEQDGQYGWFSGIIPSGARNNDLDDVTVQISDTDAGVVYRSCQGRLLPWLFVTTSALKQVYPQMDFLFNRFIEDTNVEQEKAEGAVVMNSWYALGQWLLDKLDPRQPEYKGNELAVMRQIALIAKIDPVDMLEQAEADKALLVAKFRIAGGMVYSGLARYIAPLKLQEMTMPLEDVIQMKAMNRYSYINQVNTDIRKLTALGFALGNPIERKELQDLMDAY